MNEFCAVKDFHSYTGTKKEIINQVCEFSIVDNQLYYKFIGYHEQKGFSYSDEWSSEEMMDDAIKILFERLPALGYTIYSKVN